MLHSLIIWEDPHTLRSPASIFDSGFLSSFFKRDIWVASVLCVWEEDGFGKKCDDTEEEL